MKKGYIRLFIFEIFILLLLTSNVLLDSILNRYLLIIFVGVLIVLFKFIFGFEKEKRRYTKDIIYEIIIVYLSYFILFYLFGLITGFYKTPNYYNWYAFKEILIPMIVLTIFKEFFRYVIISKCEDYKILYVLTIFLFICLDLTNIISYSVLDNKEGIFDFISVYLLPSISNNIVATYIASKGSYKINWLWLLISQLYVYLLPIVPNVGDYIFAVIKMLLPFVILGRVKNFLNKEDDKEIDRDYRKIQIIPFIVASVFILIIVYFTSGYFHYYSVAIASGSMEPNISKGDVVIIEKINEKFDSLNEGQILAFKHDGVIVVHRIINILKENNEYYFYTKGDANDNVDNFVIYEDDIIGIVNYKVPYIGLPTVWLNEI